MELPGWEASDRLKEKEEEGKGAGKS